MRTLQALQLSDVICAEVRGRTYVQHMGVAEFGKAMIDPRKVFQILGWLQGAEHEGRTIDRLESGPFGGYGCADAKFGCAAVWMLVQGSFAFPDPEMPVVNHQFGLVSAF